MDLETKLANADSKMKSYKSMSKFAKKYFKKSCKTFQATNEVKSGKMQVKTALKQFAKQEVYFQFFTDGEGFDSAEEYNNLFNLYLEGLY